MHMLEDHTKEWIGAQGVGFGLMGEQGAVYSCLIQCPANATMELVMKEHL